VTGLLSIVVAGRNDDYGGGFRERLLRASTHNSRQLTAAGIPHEFVFVEWNPLPDRPLLSADYTRLVPHSRAYVVGPDIHHAYSQNPHMEFHEMPAKNAGIRRARGGRILVTNADILFGEQVVARLAEPLDPRTLYRAHRVDVSPALDWEAMRNPSNQLPSGEGRCSPPYYLGAGGDFMLASRELWSATTGFNETVRFTTRAKDWQFCLNVVANGFGIRFIGDVYHLDHGEGFRNTPAARRNGATAHFGGLWDCEFGIPLRNPREWGLADCRDMAGPDQSIAVVKGGLPLISSRGQELGRFLVDSLTPPGDEDMASAFILYSLLEAQRRAVPLVCRLRSPRSAVALSGLEAVARREGVRVFCSWTWPDADLLHIRLFEPEPDPLPAGTLVLAESAHGWAVSVNGSHAACHVLPGRRHVRNPAFNPMLCRRLMRALFRLRGAGYRRIALFGTGGHSRDLLRWGFPDDLDLTIGVESEPRAPVFEGLPVVRPADLDPRRVDAVLLSSVTYESEMLHAARSSVPSIPVVPLYLDWPDDFWRP
jgi:hypothetical protein